MQATHHNHRQSGEEFAAFSGRENRGQFPGGGRRGRRHRPDQRSEWSGHDAGSGRGPRGPRPDRGDRPGGFGPDDREAGFAQDSFGKDGFEQGEFGDPRQRHRRGPDRRHDRARQHHGRRGPGRANRGDVRTATLLLLSEEPMHGYQLMQTIADRTRGRWTPSPGAIYPALNLLEDEGLVSVNAEGGRKLASLTEAGRQLVTEQKDTWDDPFTAGQDSPEADEVDLRAPLMEIREAARQLARRGDPAQVKAAAELLGRTKRDLYLLLAGDEPTTTE